MSRLTGNDAKSLMEAYVAVYTPQEISEEQVWEQVEEWVNSLVEEGYDLSEYSWEEMYEDYLSEMGQTMTTGQMTAPKAAPRPTSKSQVAGGGMGGRRGSGSSPGGLVSTTKPARPSNQPYQSRFAGSRDAAFQRAQSIKGSPVVGPRAAAPAAAAAGGAAGAAAASRPSGGSAGAPAAARPSGAAPSGGKPAAAAAPAAKPLPAAQTGDRAKDMDTWAKANPKLAAASAERARIRGTQQTDNPLMKDFKSRLPMNSPSVQSPDVAKLGKGNQSLTQNPSAFKAAPAPTKPAPAATATSTPATTTTKPATTSTLSDITKKAAQKPAFKEDFDAFDVVIGHLLDEGYADTEEAALAIMTNMSEEWRESIISENLAGAAKKAFKTVTNPVGAAVDAAKGLVKGATKGWMDAEKREIDMKDPKYNPRTGKIDPNFNPRSSTVY